VGIAAVQLAAWKGATVLGTAGTERGRRAVIAAGAVAVLDHSPPDLTAGAGGPSTADAPRLAAMGRSFDVIVEMLANVNLAADLRALRRGGVVAVVGNRGPVVAPLPDFRDLMAVEGSVVGVLGRGTPEELHACLEDVQAGLASGALTPLVDPEGRFPLAEAPSAHAEVIEHRRGAMGKIVLLPWATDPPSLPSARGGEL
jgi:NADPH2:quinone reductase